MGAINDVFIQNKLSLKKFEEILNHLLRQSPNKIENEKILKEIGLIKEYINIMTDKEPNLILYYSRNHKIIKNIKFLSQMRSIFLQWVKYLFDITKEDLDSTNKLNIKIEQIKLKHLTKEFFQNNIRKNIFNTKYIKALINYGIPPNLRLFIWDIIISVKYNKNKIFNYEEEFKEYKNFFQKNDSISISQIEKDIHRTFIKEEEKTPNNIQILKNVLNCINAYNKSGYCQGMNYIVAFLLKITNYNEVMTFYFFKNFLIDIKGYFDEGFPCLNKNVKIFENYFGELYPKIYKHFKKHEIINEFYITKWLQTLLTLSLSFEELSIVWDILLIYGFDFIIFICLAFFAFIEDNILKLKESADILHYLEKTMNSEGESLIPVNIKFFEQIDEFIIPINEILEKAQEIKTKINNKKNKYEFKKSDNQLINMKNNINEIKTSINNTNLTISTKLKNNSNFGNKPTLSLFPANNNLICNSNYNGVNNNKINVQQFQQQKPNYNSTKNLETYNFTNYNIKNEINPLLINKYQMNNNIRIYPNNYFTNNNNISSNCLYNKINYSTKFYS